MTRNTSSKREKAVRRHNLATLCALILFGLLVLVKLPIAAGIDGISPLVTILLLSAIIIVYRTRNADEYTSALWRTGTSLAFVITIAFLLLVPFGEGFVDGLLGAHAGEEPVQDLPTSDYALPIALGAFFIGNAWARVRGT